MRSSSRERNAFVSIVTSGPSTIAGWAGGEQGGCPPSDVPRGGSSRLQLFAGGDHPGCPGFRRCNVAKPMPPVEKGDAGAPPCRNREDSVSPVAVDQILSSTRRAADQGLVRASLIHRIDVVRRVGGVVAIKQN